MVGETNLDFRDFCRKITVLVHSLVPASTTIRNRRNLVLFRRLAKDIKHQSCYYYNSTGNLNVMTIMLPLPIVLSLLLYYYCCY